MKKTLIFALFLLTIVLSIHVSAGVITEGNRIHTSLYSQEPVQVEPGNYVEVRIKLENRGINTLKDFQVQILPEFPFSLDPNEKSMKYYGSLTSGINYDDGVIAKWKLRVDEDAVEGDNDIRIRYKFEGSDWIYSQDYQIAVETQEVILNIKEIKTIPENIVPGQKFDLMIDLENQADSTIRNLKFKLNASETFVALGSTDEQYLKTLDSEESQEITFSLISKGDADATVYTIPLTITYYDNQGTMNTKKLSFGLILLEEPNLIKNIESSEIISSGDKGDVSVVISNVGVDEIKFVELKMIPSEDYTVISSNSIYLGNIDSDDYETGTFNLYTNHKGKEVPLNFELNYKDSLNMPHKENVTLKLSLYSTGEAKKLGLKQNGSVANMYVGFVIFVFVAIFWFYMLMDLLQKRMPRYKRLTWLIILILTTVFGAVLYYFMVHRKK